MIDLGLLPALCSKPFLEGENRTNANECKFSQQRTLCLGWVKILVNGCQKLVETVDVGLYILDSLLGCSTWSHVERKTLSCSPLLKGIIRYV